MSKKTIHPVSVILSLFVLSTVTSWAVATRVSGRFIATLVYLDLICLLVLIGIVSRKLVILWIERKKQYIGSKLHVHFIGIFSFMTIVPAILVALFCIFFINTGIESWFGESVQKALNEAQTVSNAYLKEHQKAIKVDAHAIVGFLRPQMNVLIRTPALLEKMLNDLSEQRGVSEILIFDEDAKVIARSYLSFTLEMEKIGIEDLRKATLGDTIIYAFNDRVRGLIALDQETRTYLLLGKIVDSEVLAHVNETEESLNDYKKLLEQRFGIQLTFIAFFGLVVVLLLLGAIWMGFSVTNVLLKPITRSIQGAQAISQGDLSIRLENPNLDNELDNLTMSFNQMASQLQKQQHDLTISQRKAAWADAARKIAHEIKNPLTPIQLSAERLKRKYLKEIHTDPETFSLCVETIIRQVDSIKNLVREFSTFAKEPEINCVETDIEELIKQVVFLQKQSHPGIIFDVICPAALEWALDSLQMNQVLTNLVLNSINSLTEDQHAEPKIKVQAKITVDASKDFLDLFVIDNGKGFPLEHKEKLFDPYYTTRQKGTGLGLFIVSRIVSHHGGSIELKNIYDARQNLCGACVHIRLEKKA